MQIIRQLGELRPNHFHAWFRLKDSTKEGFKSICSGRWLHFKNQDFYFQWKTIYTNHPNGYTSVYGHLKINEL
jgi:hypothetical protein